MFHNYIESNLHFIEIVFSNVDAIFFSLLWHSRYSYWFHEIWSWNMKLEVCCMRLLYDSRCLFRVFPFRDTCCLSSLT